MSIEYALCCREIAVCCVILLEGNTLPFENQSQDFLPQYYINLETMPTKMESL